MRYTTSACLFLFATGWIGVLQVSAKENGIELFQAIDQGDVTVQFIALNSKQANVLIKNESDAPLQLRMPKAIAAAPVLGQFGQNQNQNPAGGGANQTIGGGIGMGHGRGLGNGQGLGMGMMHIAPGKVRKLKARTVCLEHGKPDPQPRVAYRMIPLETFTEDPIITQVCQQLGAGQIQQTVAQAIVWHQANALTWTKLANLDRMQSTYRGNIKFFRPEDLTTAKAFYTSESEPTYPQYSSSMTSEGASAMSSVYATDASFSMPRTGTYSGTPRSRNQSTCR